jgi:hypothetical protein
MYSFNDLFLYHKYFSQIFCQYAQSTHHDELLHEVRQQCMLTSLKNLMKEKQG